MATRKRRHHAKKKTHKKKKRHARGGGHIPLPILKRRLARLTKIVKARS